MDRRAFLAGIGALGAAASVRAQAPASPRIGWIAYTDPGIAQAAFQDGMRALGYSGTNAVRIEARVVAANPESTRAALEELQRLQVALIVAQGSTAPVVHRLNADHTPLLFAFSGDPVAAGMVASFGRPGGNTTGVSFLSLELVGKRLEVMREISPSVRRVAIVANPQHAGEKAELRASLDAAEHMGIQTTYVQILAGEDAEAAFSHIRRERVQGIIVFPDAAMIARAPVIADFALRERLLAVSGWGQFARAGFVATYGPNLQAAYARLGYFADRMLKGAAAGSLPVELPTRIELVVNLKTAKALGLTIPQSFLLRADEVIQ